MKRNKLFTFFFIIYSIFYWLNYFHRACQSIWACRDTALAENLLHDFIYSQDGHSIATYPMWGYSILAAFFGLLGSYEYIFLFQYVLLCATLILIYKNFDLPKHNEYTKIVLFYGTLLFYTMCLSVRWPHAIVAFCLFVFALLHKKEKYISAIITLFVVSNFRGEGLLFFIIYAVYLTLHYKKYILPICIVAILASPWSIYQYINNKVFLPTSTNSGGVLYISLGQLPNNKWNRAHIDEEANKYAVSQGLNAAWGIEGSHVLRKRFIDDVKQYPLEFAKKCLHNFQWSLWGGLYVTEVRTLNTRRNKDNIALLFNITQDIFHKSLYCLFFYYTIQL